MAWIGVVAFFAPAAHAANRDGTEFSAASGDLERVLFTTRSPLLPGDDNGCADLYLRRGQELDRIPQGVRTGVRCRRSALAETSSDVRAVAFHSRLALAEEDRDGLSDVYLWKNGDMSLQTPETTKRAKFQVISGDGSSVLFTTRERLTPDDEDDAKDLYRRQDDTFSLVTAGTQSDPSDDVRINASGEAVLFESGERLLSSDQDAGCAGAACTDIYRWEDGSVELVTTGPSDSHSLGARLSASSEDGGTIYFQTADAMTVGDENDLPDVYAWVDGSVNRVTPDPVRTPQFQEFSVAVPDNAEAGVVVGTSSPLLPADADNSWDLYVSSSDGLALIDVTDDNSHSEFGFNDVSEDLQRVTFTTRKQLLASDRDDRDDVYSWERSSGKIALVSGGNESSGSSNDFAGASATGDLVVFESVDTLLGADDDLEGLDPYQRDLESGNLTLLSRNAHTDRFDDVYTEAVRSNGGSVIASSTVPLNAGDDDDFVDLYLLDPDRNPILISARP